MERTRPRWRLLRTGPGAPADNLALDEALMTSDGGPVLRLYAWDPPALSLGYFQPLAAFDAGAARRAGAVLVRRPTGGGAIHHEHELTFAIAARPGHDGYPGSVVAGYERVHEGLRRALATLGAVVRPHGAGGLSTRPRDAAHCFTDLTALDLVDAAGRKVVGSAQRRAGGRVLHHGSIPITAPGLTPGSGSVREAAGREVGWDELADEVARGLAGALGLVLEPDHPREAERVRARALARGRYADPGWSRSRP